MEKVKLIHVTIMTDDMNTVMQLKEQLKKIQERMPDIEFLITNDKIQLTDIKHLINELYLLYKRYKNFREQSAQEVKKNE